MAAGDVVTLSSGSSEGSWTGPWVQPRFDIAEVIPSWNAHTPPGSLVQVELQGRTHVGFETPWYVMARWAFDDAHHERASVPGQADELGRVATDTFLASAALDAYRLRVWLNRGEGGAPGLRAVAAIASSAADTGVWPSPPRGGPVELAVPPFAPAGPGELDGFHLPQGTTGHLVVLVGVTGDGDAVVNDPAAETNGEVRRVYDRTQFERAWLGGSGGVVYVIHPPGKELPASPGNW